MSLLYRVLEPFADAVGAVPRARGLLEEFGEGGGEPWGPEVGDVVTVEQFRYACRYFRTGVFRCRDERPLPMDGLEEFWGVVERTGALRARHERAVEVELRLEFADVWSSAEEAGLGLGLPWWESPPFAVREIDAAITEGELDLMVGAVGPLVFDVVWNGALWGLPSAQLCGVQLCLNGVWTDQCVASAPGTHTVYPSIGPGDHDVQDEWLKKTGLGLGPALLGW